MRVISQRLNYCLLAALLLVGMGASGVVGAESSFNLPREGFIVALRLNPQQSDGPQASESELEESEDISLDGTPAEETQIPPPQGPTETVQDEPESEEQGGLGLVDLREWLAKVLFPPQPPAMPEEEDDLPQRVDSVGLESSVPASTGVPADEPDFTEEAEIPAEAPAAGAQEATAGEASGAMLERVEQAMTDLGYILLQEPQGDADNSGELSSESEALESARGQSGAVPEQGAEQIAAGSVLTPPTPAQGPEVVEVSEGSEESSSDGLPSTLGASTSAPGQPGTSPGQGLSDIASDSSEQVPAVADASADGAEGDGSGGFSGASGSLEGAEDQSGAVPEQGAEQIAAGSVLTPPTPAQGPEVVEVSEGSEESSSDGLPSILGASTSEPDQSGTSPGQGLSDVASDSSEQVPAVTEVSADGAEGGSSGGLSGTSGASVSTPDQPGTLQGQDTGQEAAATGGFAGSEGGSTEDFSDTSGSSASAQDQSGASSGQGSETSTSSSSVRGAATAGLSADESAATGSGSASVESSQGPSMGAPGIPGITPGLGLEPSRELRPRIPTAGGIESGSQLGRGQSQAEKRAEIAARAEKVMQNLDAILLKSQKDREARATEDKDSATLASLDNESGSRGGSGSQTGYAQEESEQEDAELGREASVPGDPQHQGSSDSGDFDPESDIVVRQICDLAEQEQSPELKQKLEQKCQDMRGNAQKQ